MDPKSRVRFQRAVVSIPLPPPIPTSAPVLRAKPSRPPASHPAVTWVPLALRHGAMPEECRGRIALRQGMARRQLCGVEFVSISVRKGCAPWHGAHPRPTHAYAARRASAGSSHAGVRPLAKSERCCYRAGRILMHDPDHAATAPGRRHGASTSGAAPRRLRGASPNSSGPGRRDSPRTPIDAFGRPHNHQRARLRVPA
jgi:hypothetical protein